jgi:hypothetical protein
MTSWSELPLTEEHAAYLREQAAITADIAGSHGIRSATSVDDLPEWAQSWGAQAVPAIVFPWKTIYDEVIEQVRPDTEVVYNGEAYKYLFPKGAGAVLNALRHDKDAERILIVEGTKQGLAAASWAPEGVAVYGVGGCRNWSSDGIPDSDLEVCDGKHVFICLDADVSKNRDVYDAAVKLRDAAMAEGASKVSFVRIPAGGTSGLDDVLSKKRDERRTSFVENLLAQAHPSKPCDAKPKPKDSRPTGGNARVTAAEDGSERPVVFVDGDRLEVINEITTRLLDRWDGTRLFCHGELISQLVDEGEGPKMKPLLETDGTFYDVLQETAATANRVLNADGEQVGLRYAWPDGQTVKAARSRSARFSKLEVIARAPFVRVDGSLCLHNGYDEASRTMVVMDEALAAIDVPEFPTRDEVSAAVTLIIDEWLGDFPFPDQENRANALALVLTPFVRALMDVVPLAVIDAHTPGTGKNLLVDSVLLMFLGERPQMLPFNHNDDEFRKTLTAAFREGSEVFVFDEAHHLEGASLARALTASHWKDRALGVNQMLGFPNRMTWISLGNNVRVEGDIFRRVYRVALRSPYEHPEDRPGSDFRHEDLKGWTLENRPALLRAALTIVRAWFAEGQPKPAGGVAFGGFEKFARVLGGILHTAGVDGFLGNLQAWRSESNFSSSYWESHLRWLVEQFGTAEFTASAVRSKLVTTADPAFPPIKGDPEDKANFPKSLGEAYAKHRDRGYGGLRLRRPLDADGKPRRDGTGRALWVVEEPESATGGQVEETTGTVSQQRPETSETSETPNTPAPKEKFSFSVGGGAEAEEKNISVRTEQGCTGLGGLRSLGEPEQLWAGVEQPSLFADLETASVPVAPAERAALLPTPPVAQSTVLPAHWVDLFAADAPEVPGSWCECGQLKVPDSEMRLFLLCPTCTPGTLRPADPEVTV